MKQFILNCFYTWRWRRVLNKKHKLDISQALRGKLMKFRGIMAGNKLYSGEIKIIGKKPKYKPHVAIIYDDLVVSIDNKDMERLCKAWVKANEG